LIRSNCSVGLQITPNIDGFFTFVSSDNASHPLLTL
jgi:hypothetical protein